MFRADWDVIRFWEVFDLWSRTAELPAKAKNNCFLLLSFQISYAPENLVTTVDTILATFERVIKRAPLKVVRGFFRHMTIEKQSISFYFLMGVGRSYFSKHYLSRKAWRDLWVSSGHGWNIPDLVIEEFVGEDKKADIDKFWLRFHRTTDYDILDKLKRRRLSAYGGEFQEVCKILEGYTSPRSEKSSRLDGLRFSKWHALYKVLERKDSTE